jgi:hypothetical protein
MTKGAEFLFQLQAERFREKFGRDIGPRDPVFFDPEADDPRPMPRDELDPGLFDALGVEELRADAEAVMEEHGMVERLGPKPGRNDPCPCGSGLKFKRCHGR